MNNNAQKHLTLRFSAASKTYDTAAKAQRAAADKISEMLRSIKTPERALEIGCGTGILTEKLVTLFPNSKIDAVDISGKMIKQAMVRCPKNNMIRWIVTDFQHLPENIKYPLITSASALHWITPLQKGMEKISALLESGGRLIFGLMLEETLHELRTARSRVAPHKMPLEKLPAFIDVCNAIEKANLKIIGKTQEKIILQYPSATALLKSLHEQGVTGGGLSLSATPLNRSELHRLIMDYDSSYKNADGGVDASYTVAYFVVGGFDIAS